VSERSAPRCAHRRGRTSRTPTWQPKERRLRTLMEKQLAWTLAACARVMRPVVRLALAMGVKHSHLENMLRELLLDEARRAWVAKGIEPNVSQLSVTTGLNRKAIASQIRDIDASLPRTETSAAAKTLTLWLQMLTDDPALRSLPIMADGAAPSFETIARRASHGNVHHRSILDELVRLNMARVDEGRAQLTVRGFVPVEDLGSMLSFFGDNGRDHLLAGVANILGEEPRMLERAIFAAGLPVEDCERIHQFVRERWDLLHHELTDEMTRAVDGAGGSAPGRIRVGIYTYYEDRSADPARTRSAEPPTGPGEKS
jgi:hypothetical protein